MSPNQFGKRIAVLALAVIVLTPGLCLAQTHAGEAAAEPPVDTGTTAWMLTSTALVLLMVPGLAMFYGGLVRTKNVIGTMMHAFVAMAIIGVVWAVVGYALCFGASIGGFIGWDEAKFMLMGVDSNSYHINVNGQEMAIPEVVFAMFQGKFAIITPALIAGAFAERVTFRGYCLFILLWSLLVYCPLAHVVYRGQEVTPDLIPKVRLDIAVNDDFVKVTVDTLLKTARGNGGGKIGDGKIFILPLENCIRIRTGEEGGEAI